MAVQEAGPVAIPGEEKGSRCHDVTMDILRGTHGEEAGCLGAVYGIALGINGGSAFTLAPGAS